MLSEESCEACRADAPRVSSEEVGTLMAEIPEWELVTIDSVDRLVREFKFPNFIAAIEFANQVGDLAESVSHHPRLVVEWGRVEVSWWTHKIRGLHRNDFILAARTDQLN